MTTFETIIYELKYLSSLCWEFLAHIWDWYESNANNVYATIGLVLICCGIFVFLARWRISFIEIGLIAAGVAVTSVESGLEIALLSLIPAGMIALALAFTAVFHLFPIILAFCIYRMFKNGTFWRNLLELVVFVSVAVGGWYLLDVYRNEINQVFSYIFYGVIALVALAAVSREARYLSYRQINQELHDATGGMAISKHDIEADARKRAKEDSFL
ncbi:hypothetical protein JCM19238_4409 [Vibrio ponticus]|nr:hypothetical protein JCM19238_4409 [Vibrio ponticus]